MDISLVRAKRAVAQRENTVARYYKIDFLILPAPLLAKVEGSGVGLLNKGEIMKIQNTQNAQNTQDKKFTKGFTLLELLIVVVIIGILAGIALPQYQMAVGRARFSTLKSITKSVQQAAQRYYLANNVYTHVRNLDIEIPTDIYCAVQTTTGELSYCGKKIFDKDMYYYVNTNTGRPHYCSVHSLDTTDKSNRLCQQETNSNTPGCDDSACYYKYKN